MAETTPTPAPPAPPAPPRRYSASQLPPDADPAEKEFVGLLHKALAPSYVLIRRLGAGGMGTVYVARDPVLKRLVAVKVMSPELARDADARTRFEREAQAVAAIPHPNVVSIYAVGELENGLPYIVMQFVEGRSMADRIDEDGPLDVPAARRVLGEVASALAATHKKGIIHRDIKPANILFDDETGRALVTDFGIAAVRERPDDRPAIKITQTGMAVGTPADMSPEQFLAEPITDKTDIYALGLLGYELLVGEGPYAVKTPAELMAAHLRDEPRKLSALRSDVDAELEQLLGRCLAKDPTQRPTAQFVADQLTRGTGAVLEWPPPGLEAVTEQFQSAQMRLMLGAFLIGVPLLALSALDMHSMLRQALPSGGALFLLASVGIAVLVAGFVSLAAVFRIGLRAVRNGYRWLHVAEVACDRRGDGGALIAGGREYGALSPSERNTLRRRRLAAGAMRLAGALMPVVGYVVTLVFAARAGAGTVWLAFGSVGLAVALVFLAELANAVEAWQLRKARARLAHARAARGSESTLGTAWGETLASVAVGQRLGTRPPLIRHRYLQYGLGTLVAALVVGASLLAYAMAALGGATDAFFLSGGSSIGNTADQVRQLARLERLRLPMDTSITPLRAGQFLAGLKTGQRVQISNATEDRYLREARKLSAADLDTVRRIAGDSLLPAFRTFARARTYDYAGAAVSLARLDSILLLQLPVPHFSRLRNLGAANIMIGVLALREGRSAEAELRFREVLSAGFLLIHEGNSIIESMLGRLLVLRARAALATLYQQSGRTGEASFVAQSTDPADAVVPERMLQLDQQQVHRSALRFVRDTAVPRGVRLELLSYPLAYGACGDLHQIVFGVDSTYQATLDKTRPQLVRFPSDSVIWDKFDRALDRPLRDGYGDGGSGYQLLMQIARVVDFLTGSRRMQSCVSLLS